MVCRSVRVVCSLIFLLLAFNAGVSAITGQPSIVEGQSQTNELIDENQLVAMANTYQQTFYQQIDLVNRYSVDAELIKLKTIEPFLAEVARELASAAAVMGAAGKGRDTAVVFAAAAAQAAPADPLVLNNFGAVLRFLGETKPSILVLQYALTIDPTSPLLLTNLGNSFLELEEDDKAEGAYHRALQTDKDFALAHEGLATLYMKHGEVGKALAERLKTVQFVLTPSAKAGIKEAIKQGATMDSPYSESGSASGDSTDDRSNGENSDRPPRDTQQLVIPPLPDWSDRYAFVASIPTMQSYTDQVLREGLTGSIEFAAKYFSDAFANGGYGSDGTGEGSSDSWDSDEDTWNEEDTGWTEDDEWSDEDSWSDSGDSGDWDDEFNADEMPQVTNVDLDAPVFARKLFGLELLNLYYADRLKEILDPYAARKQQISERYKQGLEELNSSCVIESTDALKAGEFDRAQRLAQDCNKRSAQLANTHFSQWKPLTRDTYEQVRRLMEEYWLYSEPLLTDVYDNNVISFMSQVRRVTVFASLMPLVMDMAIDLPVTYALADILVPIATIDQNLATPPEPMDVVQVPDKKPDECKLNGKVKGSCGPITLAISCEGFEIGYLKGVAVGAALNWKGGGTIFVGIGIEGSGGTTSMGAKAGVTVTFDQDTVVDVGLKGEIEINTGAFGAGGSGTFGASVGVVAPARVNVEGAATYKG